ncbi:hypothetical protein D9619_007879 [Psilocybe cf. subviscida]|uniref:Uncharacterized protein n=1 Tax=Psilocybe cf. subviscida TaxID=2480587 RepID=A0A8H5ATZ9_9AGAR|nr:hypothetical protein D9619_007879 [Psilocybe cf. subviscida]
MTYVGSGTRASPIAIDDSEDEVVNELYNSSNKSSPTATNRMSLQQSAKPPPPPFRTTTAQLPAQNGKRKRADSATSHAGPSNTQRSHPSLANRITHAPVESKKARKRRRKAERQAAEEARLQSINWLNNTTFAPMAPTGPLHFPLWPHAQPYFDELMAMQSAAPFLNAPPPPVYMYPYDELPYGEPLTARSPTPPPPQPPLSPPPSPPRTSDWVSSMSMASLQDHEPLPPPTQQISLPHLVQANVSGVPDEQSASMHVGRGNASAVKPAEQPQHALPPKPPAVQTIGMKPDQDPNSKHGIFHITPSTKEGGTGMKTRLLTYIPNPARTLVMEQLPKSHRGTDFINKWSRTACGALPVHVFIDGQAAKALIEFATAELARKAWASPKLGQAFSGLKPHQLKGKPREDLIKVWWYRVDGVGAGAGVGEIEEGEIEDDPTAAEHKDGVDAVLPKETKKERKARLAMEREAKRLKQLASKNERDQAEQEHADGSQLAQPDSDESTHVPSLRLVPPFHSSIAEPEEGTLSSATPTTVSNQPDATFASGYNMPTFHPLPANPMVHQAYQPHPTGFFSQQNLQTAQSSQHSLYLPSYGQAQWGSSGFEDAGLQSTASYYGPQIGASQQFHEDDHESVASSAGRSPKPHLQPAMSMSSTHAQADDLDDYEDMDVELDEVSPPPSATFVPPYQNPSFSHDDGWAGRAARLSASTNATNNLLINSQTHRSQGSRHLPYPPSKPKPLPASPAMAAVFVPRHQPGQSAIAHAGPSTEMSTTKDTVSRQGMDTAPTPSLAGLVITDPHKVSMPTALTYSVSMATPPTGSTSPSTTPTPSEPKAMKNAPTAPSFAKRALMARQKELEERITQSKLQLAATASAPPSGTSTPSQVLPKPAVEAEDKQAMEDRLRKLVLQSRKSVPKPQTPLVTRQQPEVVTPAAAPNVATTSPASDQGASSATPDFSLEDMAVSFITEAIEAVKTLPPRPPPSQSDYAASQPPPQPTTKPSLQSNIKMELAAKQKRLEEHIADTKSLMEQFSQAKTKEAKDEIMRTIREKRRLFENDSPVSANVKPSMAPVISTTSGHQNHHGVRTTTTTTQHFQITRWPGSHRNAGVLILSDEEDEDDDDES